MRWFRIADLPCHRRDATPRSARKSAIQSIIDDLDTAARTPQVPPAASLAETADLGVVMTQVESDLGAVLADQRVDLSISRVGGPFLAQVGDAALVEPLLAHLPGRVHGHERGDKRADDNDARREQHPAADRRAPSW